MKTDNTVTYELKIDPDYRERQLDNVLQQTRPDAAIKAYIVRACLFAALIAASVIVHIITTLASNVATTLMTISDAAMVLAIILSIIGIAYCIIRCSDMGEDYNQFVWLTTIPRRDFTQCQKLIELTAKIYDSKYDLNQQVMRQLFLLIAFKPDTVEFTQKQEATGLYDTLTYKPFANYPGVCTLTMPDNMFRSTFHVTAARIDLG